MVTHPLIQQNHSQLTLEAPTMDTMSPEPKTVTVDALSPGLRKRLEEAMANGSVGPSPDPWVESAEDHRERLAIQAKNRSSRWMDRLPKNYAAAALDDLDGGYLEPIRRWIAERDSITLVLAGNIGTGKTYAAYAIGNYAVAHGSWVEAWNVHDLLLAMRPDGDASAYRRATTVPLLILDDLGASTPSGWAKEQMLALVNARVSNRFRTVVTTNVSSVVLRDTWEPRMVDRLTEDSTSLVFAGESRRKAAW